MDSYEAKVRAVVAAWLVEGPNPDYHHSLKRQVYDAWPVLARAIDQLALHVISQPVQEDDSNE